jgi:hypothetical protein
VLSGVKFSGNGADRAGTPSTISPRKRAKKKSSHISRATGKDDKNIRATSLTNYTNCRLPEQ